MGHKWFEVEVEVAVEEEVAVHQVKRGGGGKGVGWGVVGCGQGGSKERREEEGICLLGPYK